MQWVKEVVLVDSVDELRSSSSIRGIREMIIEERKSVSEKVPRPNRGEGHVDFLGESEVSLPQPHDSFPDAGETMNDFWSMSGSFIFRHICRHPKEESFPIPLKYIDVTRTFHTNLDVKQEKRI